VTSTGSHTLTVNLTGSVNKIQLADEELAAGTSPTWSIDTSGTETSGDFPSLSTARSGDAYVGIQFAWGTGASGGTSGVSYDVVSSDFVVATATGVSGTISPAGTGAGAIALLVSATAPATGAIKAVGLPVESPGPSSVAVSPEAAGDILAMTVDAGNSSDPQSYVTAVSGGGVSSWSKAVQWAPTSVTDTDMEIWWGVVTDPGASTIDLTWDTTPDWGAVIVQEFSAPSGASWTFGGSGDATSNTSSETFPSLSPDGASALYVGFALPNGTSGAGTTDGFVYNSADSWSDFAYDTDVSSTSSPTANVLGGDGADTVGALLVESTTTPLLWAGQYQDPATGLYYMAARWYDPGTGQFMSVDPDLAETDEPYAYAGDDPVNRSDPTGLIPTTQNDCVVETFGKWCSGYLESTPSGNLNQIAFVDLQGFGLPRYEAAAFVGNFIVESQDWVRGEDGVIDPTMVQVPNGPGTGIAQWSNPGRWNALVNYADFLDLSPWSLAGQLNFVGYELTTDFQSVLETLNGYAAMSNVQQQVYQSASEVMSGYEITDNDLTERQNAAWDIYRGVFNQQQIARDESNPVNSTSTYTLDAQTSCATGVQGVAI